MGKIVYFGQENLPDDLKTALDEVAQESCSEISDLDSLASEGKAIVIIDCDQGEEKVSEANKKLIMHSHIKRVFLSSKMDTKDFVKHQRGEFAADAYLKKNADTEHIVEILQGLAPEVFIKEDGAPLPRREREKTSTTTSTSSLAGVESAGTMTEMPMPMAGPDDEDDLDVETSGDIDEDDSRVEAILNERKDGATNIIDKELDEDSSVHTGESDMAEQDASGGEDGGLEINMGAEAQGSWESDETMVISGPQLDSELTEDNGLVSGDESQDSALELDPHAEDLNLDSQDHKNDEPSLQFGLGTEDAEQLDSGPALDEKASEEESLGLNLGPHDDEKSESEDNFDLQSESDESDNSQTEVLDFDDAENENTHSLVQEDYKGLEAEKFTRLQLLIKELQDQRDSLQERLDRSESDEGAKDEKALRLQAEIENLKIEMQVIKRRHFDEIEEYKNRLRINDDKNYLLKEKNSRLTEELRILQKNARVDIHSTKERERVLEEKLELLQADTESQIHNREQKILALKRKIDSLEFNIENLTIKERSLIEEKMELSRKLKRMSAALKGSLQSLEDDFDLDKI